ncbi:MAG: aldo/keto reductase [Acidimicrobiaceae bacterium]|nr:aldo/keto reductase [Acidimicrobiaceae bacterium]MXW75678.1 aldo/keto reductase [Acidimicrobiaceae bacterium]MYA75821.1 aldo/keto reductase [Acidimicrobiaceae bacterium]MYC42268.1 aldo/keto reductase [Acidimicrobiaceae bacterium]MYD07930.1 aldo/keto reductase [Acidimicrobiaceae bacterium]
MKTDSRLLPDGRRVGPLSWGCWRLVTEDVSEARRRMETALSLGMNMIDTADVYGLDWGGTAFGQSESTIGRVLAQSPGLRDDMVLATKGGIDPGVPYDSSAAYLESAVDASLTRLGVERIDLWYVHRPDMLTHPADVADTLAGLVSAGKLAAVGVSNHTVAQVDALMAHLPPEVPVAANQVEYSAAHLLPLRDGTLDQCMRDQRMAVAWSPLGGGRLLATGTEAGGTSTELIALLDELAANHGVSRAVILVAFVLAHPCSPVVVIGTQNTDRMADLASAVEVSLSRAECYRIIEASEGVPLP